MKSFKKIAVLAAALAFSALSFAQSYYGANAGAIGNAVNAQASVVGNGSSYSSAKGSESAASSLYVSSAGLPGYSGQQQTLGASTSTTSTGQAFNVSSGPGASGSALSIGGAVATANGWTHYGNPHQTLDLNGAASSVSGGAVVAGTSQDGYFGGAATGGFQSSGYVGSVGIPNGVQIVGAVQDSKWATADAGAGGVTFEGGTPPGQSAAVVRTGFANGNAVVTGSFWDPAQ